MPTMQRLHLDSLDALRSHAEAWNELWERSDATLPLYRAAYLAQWIEQFASAKQFHAIAIESDGRWLAVLPLLKHRLGHWIPAGILPNNSWANCGSMLLDNDADGEVMDFLLDSLRGFGHAMLWLDDVMLDSIGWRRWRDASLRAKMTYTEHACMEVGRVSINGDWAGYKASWSRKHRQKMTAALRHLAEHGKTELIVHANLPADEVATHMRTAFLIENRGWKGNAGTSILQTPGMADFFTAQAIEASRQGHLELAFLHCADKPIAFAYGLTAKGVFHSTKVSFDPEYSDFAPGQLLRYCLLERFFSERGRIAVDFQGPMTEAHAAWQPQTYRVGRIALATGTAQGRMAVLAYRNLWPIVRAVKRMCHRPA